MMNDALICGAVRTPIGRYGGAISSVRTDDLAAIPIAALMQRHQGVDWSAVNDVVLGCANQAGEDNRNVARMASLLAGLPDSVPGSTTNRLCGSGMDAVATAARSIMTGEAELMVAGGVESMSRSPFVIGKASDAFGRGQQMHDTTLGWRFINPLLEKQYGAEAMPETAENLADEFDISRADQDKFAFWSQHKAATAQACGFLTEEIVPVVVPQRKGEQVVCKTDEHPRLTCLDKLGTLKPIVRVGGSVTAGNASGINDGAAALLLASKASAARYNLTPMARVLGTAVAGVAPRIMGVGPVRATQLLLKRLGVSLDSIDIIEMNEAFAVQVLACTRQLGLADNDARINPYGGAIAYGHPLGMSGARLVTTAAYQLQSTGGRLALCAMCVGVGQGIAMLLERCE